MTEQKLLKLTTTLMIDFLKDIDPSEFDRITIADINTFCREWIKQNVNLEKQDIK